MYAITFTSILILFIYSYFTNTRRRFIFSPVFVVVKKFPVLVLVTAALLLFSDNTFAQGSKNKEQLGLVKVKSKGFKNKKQRQTANFTSKGFDNNTAGESPRVRKKMSSFIGNGILVSKTGNNTTDPRKAAAYKNTKTLKPGRNAMGEQIARNSDAYKGNGLVKSDYKKRKDARKKSKQISQYRGDLIVKKMPKGAHPSAAWKGGKVKNSYQQKEKYRKRMMKRIGRNKNKMQPNYLQKKNREVKPTYDSRESEIWLKPR